MRSKVEEDAGGAHCVKKHGGDDSVWAPPKFVCLLISDLFFLSVRSLPLTAAPGV